MYIKKSIISKIVMTLGGLLLTAMGMLFCFTDIYIPSIAYTFIWIGCIVAVVEIIHKVER